MIRLHEVYILFKILGHNALKPDCSSFGYSVRLGAVKHRMFAMSYEFSPRF